MKKIKVVLLEMVLLVKLKLCFSSVADVYIFDIDPLKLHIQLNQLMIVIRFCLCSNPMNLDGSQDFSIVENIFEDASKNQFTL